MDTITTKLNDIADKLKNIGDHTPFLNEDEQTARIKETSALFDEIYKITLQSKTEGRNGQINHDEVVKVIDKSHSKLAGIIVDHIYDPTEILRTTNTIRYLGDRFLPKEAPYHPTENPDQKPPEVHNSDGLQR